MVFFNNLIIIINTEEGTVWIKLHISNELKKGMRMCTLCVVWHTLGQMFKSNQLY